MGFISLSILAMARKLGRDIMNHIWGYHHSMSYFEQFCPDAQLGTSMMGLIGSANGIPTAIIHERWDQATYCVDRSSSWIPNQMSSSCRSKPSFFRFIDARNIGPYCFAANASAASRSCVRSTVTRYHHIIAPGMLQIHDFDKEDARFQKMHLTNPHSFQI